jgi:hypothetical protein
MENEQEIAEEVTEVEATEVEVETEAPELNDEGNEVVKEEAVVEPWNETGEGDDLPDVAVGKHIGMKHKYKGKIAKRDDKIEQLERKLAEVESRTAVTTSPVIKPRPKEEDFDSDTQYQSAFEEWDTARLRAIVASERENERTANSTSKQKEDIKAAVVDHYERVDKFKETSGLSSENLKDRDAVVREAVESIFPGRGDIVTDHIISILGEGSEKVIPFLAVNKPALNEFKALLVEDKQGYKATAFLGKHNGRLNNPGKPRSNAPKPASNANGDAAPTQTETALKKKYETAHKKGDSQGAYNARQEGRKAGMNVSSW